ncbi:hypothetical protein EZE20_17470 [Arundinibacter roseus]|uniref:DUF4838 domain-containing protein n=2 Tax=Arundinibacter roseus TaxID=2070510 RepID=A0A4V2X994_9BACT|nr:hypothetical protein EZE20_17470 [Arundinibacter roseus]
MALSSAGIGLSIPVFPEVIPAKNGSRFTADSMVGIQMAAHSLYDEGIERTLDFLNKDAAINTLMIYSHTYYGIDKKPMQVLARDHFGLIPKNLANRKLPYVWVRHHEPAFKDTTLRHAPPQEGMEFFKQDIFKDIAAPARQRNMQVYARMLEAGDSRGSDGIKNYDKVKTVTVYGKVGKGACWNHPEYRQWIYATMQDMFETYELDGLQYGAERTGPLSNLVFKGEVPTCFCEHCRRRNQQKGIDPDRATEGYRLLYEYIKKVEAGKDDSADTVIVNVFKFMQRYPEILSWNYQWFRADEEIQQEMFNRVKRVRAQAKVVRHIDHQRSSWDIFYRSAVDYSEMTASADYIKPIVYHDVYGPRLRHWVIEEWNKRIFRDMTEEQVLDMFYAWMGYSKSSRVALDRLDTESMGPSYVFDEISRCVKAVNGKIPVIAGIGIDVLRHSPAGMMPQLSDPEILKQAVFKAIEAGAGGLLASREYDEMRHSSLRAFGQAVRQLY